MIWELQLCSALRVQGQVGNELKAEGDETDGLSEESVEENSSVKESSSAARSSAQLTIITVSVSRDESAILSADPLSNCRHHYTVVYIKHTLRSTTE